MEGNVIRISYMAQMCTTLTQMLSTDVKNIVIYLHCEHGEKKVEGRLIRELNIHVPLQEVSR